MFREKRRDYLFGLGIVAGAARGVAVETRAILPEYRLLLFGRGEETGLDEAGRALRRGFKPEEVDAVLAAQARLAHWQMLRCRVRYFADGLALGTKTSVNEVFAARCAICACGRWGRGARRTPAATASLGVKQDGKFDGSYLAGTDTVVVANHSKAITSTAYVSTGRPPSGPGPRETKSIATSPTFSPPRRSG